MLDHLQISASFISSTDDEFRCKEIESLYAKREDGDLQIKLRREEQGCGVLTDDYKVEIDGFGFHSCLCHDNFQFKGINDLIYMYNLFNKGVMPFPGSLMEQPNQLLEYFRLLDRLYKEYNDIQAEKSNK